MWAQGGGGWLRLLIDRVGVWVDGPGGWGSGLGLGSKV